MWECNFVYDLMSQVHLAWELKIAGWSSVALKEKLFYDFNSCQLCWFSTSPCISGLVK